MTPASDLFGGNVPPGFHYREDFLTEVEERALVDALSAIEFANFEMRGVVARRRVAFFGESYGREAAGPMPEFLLRLREKVAVWAGVDANAFVMSLINEYQPGAPIGWHRDAPQYGIVAGVSLLSACQMKFRPYRSPAPRPSTRESGVGIGDLHIEPNAKPVRRATHEILLARRSVYLMTDESRNLYEHHIPPVEQLRYSITFRARR
jgi:2-oxoglutarate-Fe(II)-dependent oxygenase superfamily protein